MINGITKANLIHTAPAVLANDANMEPLVETLADALARLAAKLDMATLFPNIDSLPEALLDILAADLNVYWYDYDWDITQKRESLKKAGYVHRHMGTRSAVVSALTAAYPATILQEWFEYGGEPFHFRIITSSSDLDQEWYDKVIKLVLQTKNARSVLDSICESFNVRLLLRISSDTTCGIDYTRASNNTICGDEDL